MQKERNNIKLLPNESHSFAVKLTPRLTNSGSSGSDSMVYLAKPDTCLVTPVTVRWIEDIEPMSEDTVEATKADSQGSLSRTPNSTSSATVPTIPVPPEVPLRDRSCLLVSSTTLTWQLCGCHVSQDLAVEVTGPTVSHVLTPLVLQVQVTNHSSKQIHPKLLYVNTPTAIGRRVAPVVPEIRSNSKASLPPPDSPKSPVSVTASSSGLLHAPTADELLEASYVTHESEILMQELAPGASCVASLHLLALTHGTLRLTGLCIKDTIDNVLYASLETYELLILPSDTPI